jgi:hypothetical protein
LLPALPASTLAHSAVAAGPADDGRRNLVTHWANSRDM